MACACKVNRQISLIEKKYGTNVLPSKKTDIANKVKLILKKGLVLMVCLPFLPIMVIYVLMRKCFTNKPITLDKLIKMKK